MPQTSLTSIDAVIASTDPALPVLIAGPTASGKSALALALAETQGGVVVNADASQVYDCWRVISARPSASEESRAKHLLYGHISADQPYSVGHWLREVTGILQQGIRPIIVGGTGLYFGALTQGLADIPAIPEPVRAAAQAMTRDEMIAQLDPLTSARLDLNNPMRVQRAWEVLTTTGRGLAQWQDDTPPPLLPLTGCTAIAVDADKDWLNSRIVQRFDQMLDQGALDEVAAVRPHYDPELPAHRAIGVPELMAYLDGHLTLDAAREDAIIATRQYAKRQRTWLRKNAKMWRKYVPS
ncbi:tRNA (adenosine(37)-N6)-dimethylallyltransferase MiaA [Sulfitobacter sp. CW3]|uniref:tRNA (adenosine(37)-N6)-dimethylallyltransferase MiaA n=1 Tax=Sulfitobacter sp. CW3 TaxID=2861965 RepID=UPI001C604900|nr:tRNA (adenosine(37)-N6)-dimethylallyltransferase MiaA [Sulfitobacter sp. CW3]MBW4961033.1 tRNA (adenosine(37)-N6)-dimethylallyltransferase MiaA [Sulfitobacter sp. CW3]